MKRVYEAPIITPFKVEPVEPELEEDVVEEKVLYVGWQPMEDEPQAPAKERVRLEGLDLLRGVIRMTLLEKGPRRTKRRRRPLSWYVGGTQRPITPMQGGEGGCIAGGK